MMSNRTMTPSDFVSRLREARASAILRTPVASAAAPAMEAAVRGGFRVLEFTLTTPNALGLIEQFSSRDDLLVGAGTVLTEDEARASVKAGARFLVSPVMDPKIIGLATSLGVAMIPGTFTATEMLAAHRAGAPLQKLFPAPANPPDYIRACLAPLPFLRIVPTNGVDPANAAAILEAGAWAVGFVASLFVADELKAGRFERVEERARACLAAARSARLA
jgi:2-dehydro-3-deoxyphosphogluconate aldolase / (4S)-4-hydroxy-2-oxoglutarate aldolase